MIIRIHKPSELPKDKFLKPMPCPSFKKTKQLHRDEKVKIYYYKRRFTKKPPLVFLEQEPPLEIGEWVRVKSPSDEEYLKRPGKITRFEQGGYLVVHWITDEGGWIEEEFAPQELERVKT